MSDHLGADTLVDLVEGRADDSAFARATEHAAGCAACRELLSALARFDRPDTTVRDRPKSDEPPERPSMLAIGTRVARYELAQLLGAGAMGYVYAARDPELERMIALKLLRPDIGGPDAQLVMQERLRREAQAMAQLAHPNVVAVHDVGVYEDRVFVAMEYVQGTTLAHWLVAAPRTQREILGAYIAAGRGLAAAHAAGLVHRDFKPENVMVGDDGRVRVGDFGLARPFDTRVARFARRATDTPTDLTSTGVVVGTPLYMAPEQYLGDPADARTDQFSFCVALHGAIYGVRPFAGDTFTDLAAAVLGGKIEPTPKSVRVPRRVRDAIRRGLALAPKDRWPSMDALLHELAAPRRKRVWLAPAATVLAAAAGIGLLATRSSGTPCDRDHLAGVWDAQRKASVERALSTLGLPFAGATAAEVTQLGDRYAEQFLSARVGDRKSVV